MLQEPIPPDNTIIELLKLAVPIVSLILNFAVTVYFFYFKNKKEDIETERKIALDWFKTLILDNNLTFFHEFFENVEKELMLLKSQDNLSHAQIEELKTTANEKIKDFQTTFRIKFIDSLLAVDSNIYENLIEISDEMIDNFTNCIFDPGINLTHPPKFEELVTKHLSQTKTAMIQELFKFKGLPAKSHQNLLPAKREK